ncbi:18847_t:CDS:2, partial [Funneliformis geosporum]
MKLEIWPEAIKAAKNRLLMLSALGELIWYLRLNEDNANISDSTQPNSTVGIETNGSTGNFWSHLEAHHSILRFEKESNNNPIQTKIDAIFQK